jgi:hypothetical protein
MSDTAPANAGQKQGRGRFRKGESGNPAGRKPGVRNRATVLLEAIADADIAAIMAKIVEKAKAGDATAAKILLDRLMPVPRQRAVTLALPPLKNGTGREKACALAAVLDAVAAGDIDPVEAGIIASLVEKVGDASHDCGGLLPPPPLTAEQRARLKEQTEADTWPRLKPW